LGISQFGQDQWVIDVLHGMRGGFFLDSGAADGVMGSNTLRLEREFAWTGICVEPNACYWDELVRNRTAVCAPYCLYSRNGTVKFLEAGPLGGIAAHQSEASLGAIADLPASALGPSGQTNRIRRTCRTPSALLREFRAPPVIDYWSLDTEGSEFEILRSFPFEEFGVRLLTVEHNYGPDRPRIARFLAGKGYICLGSLGVDDCYVLPGALPPSSTRFRRTQNPSRSMGV